MSDSQNLMVEIDFGFDSVPVSFRNRFEHDYTRFEKVEVTFSNGSKTSVNLGALSALSQAKNFKVVLRNGYLIMVYVQWIDRTEKTWNSYQAAITELKESGTQFKLSSILYPWLTFRAECLRQFINKKLTYSQIKEALK